MEFKTLGIMSPTADEIHNCPSYLVTSNGNKILLDAGSGSHKMNKFPEILDNLHIFITHLHYDHFNDLFNYLYASTLYHNIGLLDNPIKIYLPAEEKEIFNLIVKEKNKFAEIFEINEKKEYRIDDIKLSFSRMNHSVESYAIKVDNGFNTLCYTGDMDFSSKDKLKDFSYNPDLLLIESTLLRIHKPVKGYLIGYQASIIGDSVAAKEMVLTHFSPGINLNEYLIEAQENYPNAELAYEGMVKKIGSYK